MEIPDSIISKLVLLALLIFINAFFAAAEIAIITVRARGLKKERGESRIWDSVSSLLKDTRSLFSTIQIMVTVVGFLSSAIAAQWYAEPFARYLSSRIGFFGIYNWEIISIFFVTMIISYLFLVLGELFPKALAVEYPDRIAVITAPVIHLTLKALYPLVKFLILSVQLVGRVFRIKLEGQLSIVTEDEIRAIIDEGTKEGIVEPDERRLIYSVLEFSNTMIKEIMTPRVDVVALEKGMSADEALNKVIESGYSRMPVYEKDMDHVVGIVHIKDLIDAKNKGKPLSVILRIAHFIPDTMRLDDAIKEFRKKDIHMAVVSDEYGGVSGIATMEDILEEIVGEIRDEYDQQEEEPIQRVQEGIVVLGNVNISDINEALGVSLDDSKVNTIGGFVTGGMGHYPSVGEVYEDDQVKVFIMKTKGRRLEKLRIVRKDGRAAEAAEQH
ncbi:MAG: hemolysin family protein [Deltaproteobacteria bacterium]|nr:hemolysin family protein [Deltaproteobacteria bacterium]MCL5276355.1 hemolysin family protein [Deltaproteobacteria bacterium]